MSLYANIVIDVTTSQLDRIFQYRIPDAMCERVKVGSCVRIPFSRGNRLLMGYVVELTDIPNWDVEKIKEIESIVEGALPVEAQMIQLAAWIRKQYGGSMIQALKVVMPVKEQVRAVEQKFYTLAVSKEEAQTQLALARKRHYVAKARLLSALLEKGEIDSRQLKELAVTTSTVKSMEQAGILNVVSRQQYRLTVLEEQHTEKIILNQAQAQAVEQIWSAYRQKNLRPWLIHGITGSGKTEVYMELMERMCQMGRQIIVLIPEIALTKQTVMRFYGRFGARISMVNSRLSAGEKYDQFMRARRGEIDIMIGPRSALFTPFPNLGLIIVDEEHEQAYRSEVMPRYHARETAQERARLSGALLVLGSATPSLEAYYRAKQGMYGLVELTKRAVTGSRLPHVDVVDLRREMRQGNRSIFSRRLEELMRERLRQKEQIILFLNRRGYAGFVSCRSCGKAIKCPHCDVSMTLHQDGSLICHYCGYRSSRLTRCPACGSSYIAGFGLGTQRVEQMTKALFPTARVLRMDLDSTSGKEGHERILGEFRQGNADILIGTQMIVKGHDFANVTLVGILAADLSLHTADYRCAERTFQLVTQAAGRAGRGQRPGNVVIQTYLPEHYSIQAAAKQDYALFYREELRYRRLLQYPPVGSMMALWVSSEEKNLAEQVVKQAAAALRMWQKQDSFEIIGPSEAAVFKIKDIYRMVLYIKTDESEHLVQLREGLEKKLQAEKYKNLYIQYDFNV